MTVIKDHNWRLLPTRNPSAEILDNLHDNIFLSELHYAEGSKQRNWGVNNLFKVAGITLPVQPISASCSNGARQRMRSSSLPALVVPATRRSSLGHRAFRIAAARAWNSLPSTVNAVFIPLNQPFKLIYSPHLFHYFSCIICILS